MSTNPRDNISLPGKLVVFEGIDRYILKLACYHMVKVRENHSAYFIIEGINIQGDTTSYNKISLLVLMPQIYHYVGLDTKCGTILSEHLTTRDAVRSRRAIHLLFSANRWEMMLVLNV